MIYNDKDPKTLKDLWEIKDEAYREVSHFPTIKEKIHKRIQMSSKSAKRIKKIHTN